MQSGEREISMASDAAVQEGKRRDEEHGHG